MTEATEYPINGILDLHTFAPRDVGSLVPEYLRVCRGKGLQRVRIIHGKGTGTLRRHVHQVLDELSMVQSYELAGDESGWGATVVRLQPADTDEA